MPELVGRGGYVLLAGAFERNEQPAMRAFEAPVAVGRSAQELGFERFLAVRADDFEITGRRRGFSHASQRTRTPRGRLRGWLGLALVLVGLGAGRIEDRPAVAAALRVSRLPGAPVPQMELDGLLDESLRSRAALGGRLFDALSERVWQLYLGHGAQNVPSSAVMTLVVLAPEW